MYFNALECFCCKGELVFLVFHVLIAEQQLEAMRFCKFEILSIQCWWQKGICIFIHSNSHRTETHCFHGGSEVVQGYSLCDANFILHN